MPSTSPRFPTMCGCAATHAFARSNAREHETERPQYNFVAGLKARHRGRSSSANSRTRGSNRQDAA